MIYQPRSISKTAVARRIHELPKMAITIIEMYAQGQARALRSTFHDGIKSRSFGLYPLKDATIAHKDAVGMEKPDTPLYGLGDETEDSYANMMEVVKDESKRVFYVRPRDEYHEVLAPDGSIVKSRFKLKDLFMVHEYGCTIANGFGKGILIRIPPRPAMRQAYKKIMNIIKARDPAKEVRDAVRAFVKDNDTRAMALITKRDWAADLTGSVSDDERKARRLDP